MAALRAPSPPEKIAICHLVSGDRWAGAEVQVAALLRKLVQRDELVLSAIVLNEGRLVKELRSSGIEVRVIPEASNGFFRILREAARSLRGRQIRIIHSHRYKENLLATLLGWWCRIPFVVRTQHGRSEPFRGLRRLKHGFLQSMDRFTARYGTDRVISVSSEMQMHLTQYVDDRRVVTIHNGLEIERVKSGLGIAEAKEILGIPCNAPVIATAGRLEPVKRLDIFWGVAQQVAVRQPHVRFVIAGTGSQEAQVRSWTEKHGLAPKVLLLGQREDICDILRALDVFVLTSDHEGLPTVLLEALWLGVPVVARAVGGIPEVIQDDVNGVLIERADASAIAEACLSLLKDESRRKRLALAGAKTVSEKFTADQTAGEVAKLYASLCGVR